MLSWDSMIVLQGVFLILINLKKKNPTTKNFMIHVIIV